MSGTVYSHLFHLISRNDGKELAVFQDKNSALASPIWTQDPPDPQLVSEYPDVRSTVPTETVAPEEVKLKQVKPLGKHGDIIVGQKSRRHLIAFRAGAKDVVWEQQWEKDDSIERTFTVAGDRLYIHDNRGSLECRSVKDFSKLGSWGFGGILSSFARYQDGFRFLIFEKDFVLVGFSEGDMKNILVKLDAPKLKERYRQPMFGTLRSCSYIHGERLLCRADALQLVDLKSGKIVDKITQSAVYQSWTKICASGPLAWFTEERGGVGCYDLSAQKKVWDYPLPSAHAFKLENQGDGIVRDYMGGAIDMQVRSKVVYVESIEQEVFGSTNK